MCWVNVAGIHKIHLQTKLKLEKTTSIMRTPSKVLSKTPTIVLLQTRTVYTDSRKTACVTKMHILMPPQRCVLMFNSINANNNLTYLGSS
jgi:hypothetical protein